LLLQQRSCPLPRAALPFPPLCARCTCSSGFQHTIDVEGRNAGVRMLLRLCNTSVCARRLC
jgi:hypothetical protein